MATYYGEWKNYEDLKADYQKVPDEASIIYAGYTYEDYSGSAVVVFELYGEVFENHDGHCSCNGLEHWDPERTSVDAIRMRPNHAWPGLQEALTARFG